MGGGNTKEKPKEKDKRDQARTIKAIQNALDSSATRLDLNNRHIRELPEALEGKKDALKWLSISHNELRTLSELVCQFVNLSALRLNGNQLSALPDAISTLSALQVLDLSKNKFTQWDPHINTMASLTDLNLQCNQIGSLPEDFGALTGLKYLNLYINEIANFDVKWSLLSNLTNLDLSYNGLTDASLKESFVLPSLAFFPLCGNKLTTIPPAILALSSLKLLDMRFNQLEVIPDDLTPMATGLKILKLSNNNLRVLPKSLSQLVMLEELDLSSNQLEDLENVQGLTKLTALHVYWNKVKTLPDDFGNLVELRDLYLIDNEIGSLPESMSKLVNLRTFMIHFNDIKELTGPIVRNWPQLNVLHLGSNHIGSLPAEINGTPNLTRLDLRGNMLSTLPMTLNELKTLVALDIGDNHLLSLPPVLVELPVLNSLNLFSNGLTSLPAAIENLKSLTSLNISFNQLASLPPELASLTTLLHLRAEGNFFKEFPEPIFALTALKELAIGSNRQIKEVPASISHLASLTTFQASSNQISFLPDTFVALKNLTELDLSHNRLAVLPSDLDHLTALTDLDLSGNVLTSIPSCFGNMRALQQVKVSFNPGLVDVPEEYLKGPTWISCTGNSKIEAEFYFSRKKASDKSGRWQPTEEEDFAPISPPTPSPVAQVLFPPAASTPPPSSVLDDGSSHTPEPAPTSSSAEEASNVLGSSSLSGATPPSPSTPAPIATSNDGNSSSAPADGAPNDEDDSVKKPGTLKKSSSKLSDAGSNSPSSVKKQPKAKKTTGSSPAIDFHTSAPQVDDRRLTIIPANDGSTANNADEWPDKPLNSSTGSSGDAKKDKDKVGKDKKAREEDKKREKELLVAASAADNNLVRRTPQVGWAEMRGARPDMQDSLILMENFLNSMDLTLLGLFDGHGGTESALLTAKKTPILMHDAIRHVLEARGLEVSSNSLRMLAHADLALIIRATFMGLHGAIAKAGYTDGTAASVALIIHQYGHTPKTPTPPKENWTTTNLNVIYGDEEYPDGPIAAWCDKAKSTQILLTNPPTSVYASQLALTGSATTDSDADPSPSRPDTPVSSSSEINSSSSKKKKNAQNKTTILNNANTGRSLLVLGNCGDQRVVLCRKGQAFALTKDHKPENPSEMARIARSGGFVAESRRVNGLLALSRAIGDITVQPHVTFEPDIMVLELTEHDEFIIVACDGVWDVLSSEQAVYLALAEPSPSRAANRIREYAFSLGSTDNISVVIYQLKSRDRTNFGISVMTHIAESQALQSTTVPRINSALASSNYVVSAPSSNSPRDSGEPSPSHPQPSSPQDEGELGSSPPGDGELSPLGKKRKKARSNLDLHKQSTQSTPDKDKQKES